jgi:hypothetical protein
MSQYQSAHPSRNTMAQTSLGSAAVAWIVGGLGTCCLTFIPFISIASFCTGALFLLGNGLALVTGFLGRRQIKEEGGSKEDEQWATIGMILGGVGSVFGVGFLCLTLFGSLALLGPQIGDVFSEINRGLEATPIP